LQIGGHSTRKLGIRVFRADWRFLGVVSHLHAMTKEEDSDDDLMFVKEILPITNRKMPDFIRLWKKSKIEAETLVGATWSGAIEEALPIFRVHYAPWPPLNT
jgi:hypothetical protein